MSRLADKKFWDLAFGRALRTFLQGFVTLLGSDLVNVTDIPYASIFGLAATMALVSLATSAIKKLPEEDSGD